MYIWECMTSKIALRHTHPANTQWKTWIDKNEKISEVLTYNQIKRFFTLHGSRQAVSNLILKRIGNIAQSEFFSYNIDYAKINDKYVIPQVHM